MKSIFDMEFYNLPDEVNYDHVYDILSKFIPEKTTKSHDVLFIFCCGLVAAFASYYNYTFSKIYVHDIAKRWGFTESDASLFGEFCGIVGLMINVSINAKSINQAYDVLSKEIAKKLKGSGKAMPDDNIIRLMTGIMCLLSVIGAIPNIKFVYDTTKDNTFYLIFMEIIQFITTAALNLRGLYNTFKVSSEKKEVCIKYKAALLNILRPTLINKNQVGKADIPLLSQGILVRKRLPYVRKALSIGLGIYVGGYSSAFFFAAQSALPPPDIGRPFNDFVSFGETGCGLLSASLKWFFLGNAYSNFVDKVFSLFDQPILVADKKEIRPGIVTRNAERLLTLIAFFITIFSLGSSSKIVEKYFFTNVEKTSETFWLSLLIGGVSALGINASDLSTVLTELINFGGHVFHSRRANYSPADRFGNSHDEMIMILMSRIAKMPENDFLQEFTQEFLKDDLKMDAMEQGLEDINNLHDQPGLYIHGRYINDKFQMLQVACKKLETVTNNSAFESFKEKYMQQLEEQKHAADAHRDYSPLLSRANTIQ